MNPTRHSAVLALVLFALPLVAAEPARPLDPKARYQRESARCMAIRTHGERANCLSEASTALAASAAL